MDTEASTTKKHVSKTGQELESIYRPPGASTHGACSGTTRKRMGCKVNDQKDSRQGTDECPPLARLTHPFLRVQKKDAGDATPSETETATSTKQPLTAK